MVSIPQDNNVPALDCRQVRDTMDCSRLKADMKSETRANWIFLTVFMLLMGPGLIILSVKAYKKGAAGMNPPAPQTVSAYNNPTPQNPMLPRVAPPQTREFVETVAQRMLKLQPGMTRSPDAADGNPIISERRWLELMAAGPNEDHFNIAIFAWNSSLAPLPGLYEFTAFRNGQSTKAGMVAYEQQNLPIDIRSELQAYSYILPPDSVMWIILQVPGSEPVDAIEMKYTMNGKTIHDRLPLRSDATTSPSTP